MKKYGLRMTFFVLSFTVGISFVWSISLFAGNRQGCEPEFDHSTFEIDTVTVKNRKKGLEIKFKEFVETKDGIAADFEITNHDYEFYTYSAYTPENENSVIYTLPKVKLDGQEINEFRCGSGLVNYILKSGESRIFRYSTNHLAYRWAGEKNFQISFYFKKENNQEYKEFWSENLLINDKIVKQLLKQKEKYGVD